MTGRTPGQHGVFDFFRMDSPVSRHIRFFNSNDVQCETIWSLASAGGLRTTTINFPAMFPPPHISGYVVPGWVPWKQLRLACWPEDLFEKLKAIPGFNQRELAMDIKLEEKATEGISDHAELGPWIELHARREQNLFQVLRHLTEEDPSELTAVLFDGVDKLQHLGWRFLRPEDDRPLTEDWEFQIRELCLNYFRCVDNLLQQMCELAGPEATVLIASDHGFGPTYDVLHINTWLEQHGYLAWSEAGGSSRYAGRIVGGRTGGQTHLADGLEQDQSFRHHPHQQWYLCRGERRNLARRAGRRVSRVPQEAFRRAAPDPQPADRRAAGKRSLHPRRSLPGAAPRCGAGPDAHTERWRPDVHPALGRDGVQAARRCPARTGPWEFSEHAAPPSGADS